MNMRKAIARMLRIPAILRGVKEGGENWRYLSDAEALAAYQLEKLNETWADAVENVPFYKWWKERHGLPDRIGSLEEYAKWPVLTKSDLQQHAELTRRKTDRKFHESVTGGATGEPLHFGTFPEQGLRVSASMIMARAGLDFFPGDRVFLFWGHRHFYGHGFKSKVKFFVRRCKDWLNNTYRADACDLSATYLRKMLKKIERVNPEVIVAYSASLRVLVAFAKECGVELRLPRLKCIVCTAGPLLAHERKAISGFLGAPVYMEYGAMDAGQMAYMAKDGVYHVFSNYRMLHTANDGSGDLALVTSLEKDYLPFFRYATGDFLSGCKYIADGRVATFGEVYGRGADMIQLPCGITSHAYAFMVCAEEISKVLAYQIVQRGDRLTFCAQTSSRLTEREREIIRDKAYSIIPQLRAMGFGIEEKDELIKAPSGKIRLLVKEGEK